MQELPILRNSAGRAIRVMGVPDGEPHLSVIQNGKVISTHPVSHLKSDLAKPRWNYMPKDFVDTMPTQPAALDETHTGKHNYPPPDWELLWTKRLLFVAIVVAIMGALAAIVA